VGGRKRKGKGGGRGTMWRKGARFFDQFSERDDSEPLKEDPIMKRGGDASRGG